MKKDGNKKKQLKPCPYCGSTRVILDAIDGIGNPFFWVQCRKCGASASLKLDAEAAAAAWNRRVAKKAGETVTVTA